MFERLFGTSQQDPAIAERIPPGQYKTDKFPVLHYGSVPRTDLATWDFRVFGEIDAPFTLTWEQFKALPRKTVRTVRMSIGVRVGSPSSTTRSACLPVSIEPYNASSPRTFAPLSVMMRIASPGVKPASISSS